MKSKTLITLIGLTAASLTFATPAADYLGGGVSGNWPGATGFWFSVNQNITVTGVAFYDLTGTGLVDRHTVGIFKADGSAVVNGIVDAGTVDPLTAGTVGGSRVKNVTSTLLVTGQNYYCVSDNLGTDKYTFGNGAVTFASELNWLSFGDIAANDIFSGVPSMPGGESGNLAGSFVYSTVPEPCSMIALACGAVALIRRRKR